MVTNISLSAAFVLRFFSGFSVGRVRAEDLVNQGQQRVGDGHNSALLASAGYEALISSTEIRADLHRSRPRALDHQSSEPHVPLGRASGLFDVGTLVVARTKSYPAAEVLGGWELLHTYTR